jgi:hypothetical protein
MMHRTNLCIEKTYVSTGVMAHICNHSYLERRDEQDLYLATPHLSQYATLVVHICGSRYMIDKGNRITVQAMVGEKKM